VVFSFILINAATILLLVGHHRARSLASGPGSPPRPGGGEAARPDCQPVFVIAVLLRWWWRSSPM